MSRAITLTCLLHPALVFLLLLQILHLSSTISAQRLHLPAVRTSRPRTKPSTSAAVQSPSHIDRLDDKRVLASRLLRTAASHKQHSLHDVLADAPERTSPVPPLTSPQPHPVRHPLPPPTPSQINLHTRESTILHAIVAHTYPSAQNSTNGKRPRSISIYIHEERSTHRTVPPRDGQPTDSSRRTNHTGRKSTSRRPKAPPPPTTASEEQLLRASVAALEYRSPTRLTAALRNLEELCHSIHYGRALQSSGGFQPVLNALSSRHRPVRAAAAWTVATCCQNNPPVQRAALQAGAIPTLARLAWQDVLTVRARALFALNAVLGMEEARQAFENLPFATQVVTAALRDGRDFRATRRALNLVELLVRRNLDAWKTQLEAWDVPSLVERLMREHSDIDVRESAARIIAALDGRTVA